MTIWSVIANRIDGVATAWKEWRVPMVSVSQGVPSANSIVMLGPTGLIDPSMLPTDSGGGGGGGGGGGAVPVTAVAGENINLGSFVYVGASDSKLYNAVWSPNGFGAIGYVLASFVAGTTATYYLSGTTNTALSGLTPGVRYYGDSSTNGGVTTVVPSGIGVVHQFVGWAVNTTTIEVNLADVVILAI